jgi:Ca2+/H+ antiporter
MLSLLASGQADVVKGQIAGSIIGNSLLGLGLAIALEVSAERNSSSARCERANCRAFSCCR